MTDSSLEHVVPPLLTFHNRYEKAEAGFLTVGTSLSMHYEHVDLIKISFIQCIDCANKANELWMTARKLAIMLPWQKEK